MPLDMVEVYVLYVALVKYLPAKLAKGESESLQSTEQKLVAYRERCQEIR